MPSTRRAALSRRVAVGPEEPGPSGRGRWATVARRSLGRHQRRAVPGCARRLPAGSAGGPRLARPSPPATNTLVAASAKRLFRADTPDPADGGENAWRFHAIAALAARPARCAIDGTGAILVADDAGIVRIDAGRRPRAPARTTRSRAHHVPWDGGGAGPNGVYTSDGRRLTRAGNTPPARLLACGGGPTPLGRWRQRRLELERRRDLDGARGGAGRQRRTRWPSSAGEAWVARDDGLMAVSLETADGGGARRRRGRGRRRRTARWRRPPSWVWPEVGGAGDGRPDRDAPDRHGLSPAALSFDRPPPFRGDRPTWRSSSRVVTPPWREPRWQRASAPRPPQTSSIATSWRPGSRWPPKNDDVAGEAAVSGTTSCWLCRGSAGGRASQAPPLGDDAPLPPAPAESGHRPHRTRPVDPERLRLMFAEDPPVAALRQAATALLGAEPERARSALARARLAGWLPELRVLAERKLGRPSPSTWEGGESDGRLTGRGSTPATTCVTRRARPGICPKSSSTPTSLASRSRRCGRPTRGVRSRAAIIRLYFSAGGSRSSRWGPMTGTCPPGSGGSAHRGGGGRARCPDRRRVHAACASIRGRRTISIGTMSEGRLTRRQHPRFHVDVQVAVSVANERFAARTRDVSGQESVWLPASPSRERPRSRWKWS